MEGAATLVNIIILDFIIEEVRDAIYDADMVPFTLDKIITNGRDINSGIANPTVFKLINNNDPIGDQTIGNISVNPYNEAGLKEINPPKPDDCYLICYTSGSRPIMLTHKMTMLNLAAV